MTHMRRAAKTPESVGCNCLLGGTAMPFMLILG
jgi:hypothetical protein